MFYLTAATAPAIVADCEIPAGVPLVGTPSGSIGWMPTDGTTDEELLEGLAGFMEGVANPSASLDGRPLDVASGYAETGVYTMPVELGSFMKTVDPALADLTETRVASAAWVVRIHPLSPGRHELVLADDLFDGTDWVPYSATFHITVRAGRR